MLYVNWESRLFDKRVSQFCLCRGKECPIYEPTHFSPQWYSHKLNGLGWGMRLQLLLVLVLLFERVGPFPQEATLTPESSQMVFRKTRSLRACYLGFRITTSQHPMARTFSVIHARHENANGRFKKFAVLSSTYRHDISTHHACFFAVLNVTSLSLSISPLFRISPPM